MRRRGKKRPQHQHDAPLVIRRHDHGGVDDDIDEDISPAVDATKRQSLVSNLFVVAWQKLTAVCRPHRSCDASHDAKIDNGITLLTANKATHVVSCCVTSNGKRNRATKWHYKFGCERHIAL